MSSYDRPPSVSILASAADSAFGKHLAADLKAIHFRVKPDGVLDQEDSVLVVVSTASAGDQHFRAVLAKAAQENRQVMVLLRDGYFPGIAELHLQSKEILSWQDFEQPFPELVKKLANTPIDSGESRANTGVMAINSQTFRNAAEYAKSKLAEIHAAKGLASERLANEEALIGHLPQWHHLFMGAYGAFFRPAKEKLILTDIDRGLNRLINTNGGMVLHMLSGDSGCGKSTLARQIIYRLVQQHDVEDFSNIMKSSDRLKIIEVTSQLKEASLREVPPLNDLPRDAIIMCYIDDLFALDDANVNRLLAEVSELSNRTPVYLFATSPSWLFNRKDLEEKKKTFQLLDLVETRLGAIDDDDRQALRLQYLEMHPDNARPELLRQIEDSGGELILFKIALHHNLNYSEYFDQLFRRLEEHEPKVLTALLLFSITARFYVHFPVDLLKEMNRSLRPADQLPESAYFYEDINDAGLRLFRLRPGTRTSPDSAGMPETLAPFHDRVAQIIYTTWGENRHHVPLFNRTLRELKDQVYQVLDSNPKTRPVLSRIFRGHLRIASDVELRTFVNHFGPVRQKRWIMRDSVAAYQWIHYSKQYPQKTKIFRGVWEQALKKSSRSDVTDYLTLILLNPLRIADRSFRDSLQSLQLEKVDSGSFAILRGVLDAILSRFPLPVETLGQYLLLLIPWLDKTSGKSESISRRYAVIASVAANNSKIYSRLLPDEVINLALSRLITSYLFNIENENGTNELLGKRGLLSLVQRIHWKASDAQRIAEALRANLQGQKTRFASVLYEHLSYFAQLAGLNNVDEMIGIFLSICENDPSFTGHTYMADALWRFVARTSAGEHERWDRSINRLLSDLVNGNLTYLENSSAYPDFAGGLVQYLADKRITGSPEALFAIFEPLVNRFAEHDEVPYVFTKARRLDESFIQTMSREGMDSTRRQIRLCFAKHLALSLEESLEEFLDLLHRHEITIPYAVVAMLGIYLRSQSPQQIAVNTLTQYRERFYSWLRETKDLELASACIALTNNNILFSGSELSDLWPMVTRSIKLIPHRIHPSAFPFMFLEWWFSHAANRDDYLLATESLLDVTWAYMLENSDAQIGGRCEIYHRHFLFLLAKYGLERNESWWGRAISSLVDNLDRVLRSAIHGRGKKQTTGFRRYRKQQCLEQILEALLVNLRHQPEPRPEFEKAAQEALGKYQAKGWSAPWIAMLTDVDRDRTTDLINHFKALRDDSVNAFDVRNHLNWWLGWVDSARRDLKSELSILAQWLGETTVGDTALYILADVMNMTRNKVDRFAWGRLVEKMTKSPRPELTTKSILLESFIEYVSAYEPDTPEVIPEIAYLENASNWYVAASRSIPTSKSVRYGLTKVFGAAAIFNLDLDDETSRAAFLELTSAQIKSLGSSSITQEYFRWQFNKGKRVDLEVTIKLLRTHANEDEAVWALMFLLQVAVETSYQLSAGEIRDLWSILQGILGQCLIEPARHAARSLCKILTARDQNQGEEGKLLREISNEYFALCEKHYREPQVTYLLSSFLPFWEGRLEKPSADQIVTLWRSLLLGTAAPESEVFDNLTRQLTSRLAAINETELERNVNQTLIDFVEQHPQHPLAPKFVSDLGSCLGFASRLASHLSKLVICQSDLKDTAFALSKFFKFAAPALEYKSLVDCERELILVLRENIEKPSADLCIINLAGSCTRAVHNQGIAELARAFLRNASAVEVRGSTLRALGAIHYYEIESEMSGEVQRGNLRTAFEIIRVRSKEETAARFFTYILHTWDADSVPRGEAILTMKQLLTNLHPSRWRRAAAICVEMQRLFGSDLLIGRNMDVRFLIDELDRHKQDALIALGERIATEE
jgi:GTPase SAR1 family protein